MMVVSDVTRARSRRDKAPMVVIPATLVVGYASESSRANPPRSGSAPPEWKAYVTMDTLKNLMTTMTDTIL